MKFTAVLALAAIAQAAPVLPSAASSISNIPSDYTTNYSNKFGIQIVAQSTSSAVHKRDGVAQIGDGQIQVQSSVTLQTVTPPAPTTAPIINQIGDGQIQNQKTNVVSIVNQIGDGQIQNQPSAAVVINQISDGQIQNQPVTSTHVYTTTVVNQISDGQIQNQAVTSVITTTVVNQISDGQIQKQGTATPVTQISDGQPQATGAASSLGRVKACLAENNLAMTLKDSVLTDSKGRIGAIVANRQFQFDGPPVQAGTIYGSGWAITPDGHLALGSQDTFFQCLSGDFYNLYDESIGGQCEPVKFSIIDLVAC